MEFPPTQWTLLAHATLHGDAHASAALAEFCTRYRQPVLQFIRHRGVNASEAEDLAQDFLVHVLEKSALRRADASRGRFRSFLLGVLVCFLRDQRERQSAQKRGGGVALESLDDPDAVPAEAAGIPPPEVETFDREWAVDILARSVQALETEFAARGRSRESAVLRDYLLSGVQPPPYEAGAAALGLSLPAFKSELHRTRNRLRSLLREQVAMTVASPEDVTSEIAYLGRVLQFAAG